MVLVVVDEMTGLSNTLTCPEVTGLVLNRDVSTVKVGEVDEVDEVEVGAKRVPDPPDDITPLLLEDVGTRAEEGGAIGAALLLEDRRLSPEPRLLLGAP